MINGTDDGLAVFVLGTLEAVMRTTLRNRRGLAVILVPTTSVAAILVAHLSVVSAQQDRYIRVDDPRPLAAAATKIESLCHCVVNYEDQRWSREQVVDVTVQVRQDYTPTKPKVFSPAGQVFEFSFPTLSDSAANSRNVLNSLRGVLEAFHRSGNPGEFIVVQRGTIFSIRPKHGSLLDTRVSLQRTDTSALELIRSLLQTIGAAQSVNAIIGIAPEAMLGQLRLQERADNEPAETVLMRVLAATTRNVSWLLLYDFGSQKYVLNLHVVQ